MSARFILDRQQNVLFCAGKTCHLTPLEADLIQVLASRQGYCLHKEWIFRRMYGPDTETGAKVVDVILCRLRRKLRRGEIDLDIRTYWGNGIVLNEPLDIFPPQATLDVIMSASVLPILRELLRRCADRPADAALAERAWQQIKVAQPVAAVTAA